MEVLDVPGWIFLILAIGTAFAGYATGAARSAQRGEQNARTLEKMDTDMRDLRREMAALTVQVTRLATQLENVMGAPRT